MENLIYLLPENQLFIDHSDNLKELFELFSGDWLLSYGTYLDMKDKEKWNRHIDELTIKYTETKGFHKAYEQCKALMERYKTTSWIFILLKHVIDYTRHMIGYIVHLRKELETNNPPSEIRSIFVTSFLEDI